MTYYFGIDYDIVWNAVTSEIPTLRDYMTVILDKEGT